MDQNPQRNPRGRARGLQQFPENLLRMMGSTPRAQLLPSTRVLIDPNSPFRGPPPQPAQVPKISIPRHPAPRPENNRNYGPQEVDQITNGVNNLFRELLPPSYHDAVCSKQVIDTEYYRMLRPDSSRATKQGTWGNSIDLVANYFPISTNPNWSLYQYRINFSPGEDNIAIKRSLLGIHRMTLGGAYLFDGNLMLSSTKYDSKEFKLLSKRQSDDQIVTITVIFTNVLGPNDYAYIQVFNLLLRKCMSHLKLTLIGRKYYDVAAKTNINKYKLQLWPGYETIIGRFDSGLLFRTEISTKIMRDETVCDLFNECLNKYNGTYGYKVVDEFKAAVIGTVVLTRFNNKTYRIYDVKEELTPRNTFMTKNGTIMTYMEYYETKLNISIRNADQPLLVSKKNKSISRQFNKDDDGDIIYLVPELCSLTGITVATRQNLNLMKELADCTKLNPMERIKKYHNFMNQLQSTPEAIKTLKNLNLDLNKDLVKLNGRVLSQQLVHSNGHMYKSGNEADWTRYVRSFPMYSSAILYRWVVLYPQQSEIDVRAFINTLQLAGKEISFNIPPPEYYPINASYINGYSVALERIINQSNPSFILCVTQSQRTDVYNLIKRHLCHYRAVPSQVVSMKTVTKNKMSICTKIAIQINCKIGGAPWKISIPTPGIMIVGFDICEDKVDKNKSYGATIASINEDHTKYFSCVQLNSREQAMSNQFALSVCGALNAYRELNEELPEMIIIYRDGVNDGDIPYVHKTEVKLVKEACKMLYGNDIEPPMAFIIVKKRNGTRFFCTPQGSPPCNPPPGTVVDTVITNPTMYDFFLVSQNVKFGSVTPTYYIVIEDTLTNWSPDKMQLLTYQLTHMYYNWSGTIQVPAHCQLAHKLAFLTAQHIQGLPNIALKDLLYFL